MPLSVNKALLENYANYYEGTDGVSEWRCLGAIDKCTNIVLLCSSSDRKDVLEIGCGDGAILERLAATGFSSRFTGLEISASGVRAVQEKNIPGTSVELFDGYQLRFVDQQFDLAILSHVLEHVEYPRRLIQEAARVANKVFVEVPLEDNLQLPKDFVFDRVGHINFYNVKTIRRLLQSCGMVILGSHLSHASQSSYVFRKGKVRGAASYLIKESLLKIWPRLAAASFTYHYALICTKAT
jgi:SAM-dependent methyltransferase